MSFNHIFAKTESALLRMIFPMQILTKENLLGAFLFLFLEERNYILSFDDQYLTKPIGMNSNKKAIKRTYVAGTI